MQFEIPWLSERKKKKRKEREKVTLCPHPIQHLLIFEKKKKECIWPSRAIRPRSRRMGLGLTPRQDLKATSVTRILQSIAPASLQVNRSVGSSCVDQYLLDKDPFSPKSIRYVPELPVRSQSRLRHHGSGSARFAHRVLQQKPKGIRQTYSTIHGLLSLVRKKFKTLFNFLIFSCHVQRSCQTALSFLDGESLQPKVLLQTESSLNSTSTCVHPFFCLAYILLNPIFKLYQFFLSFFHIHLSYKLCFLPHSNVRRSLNVLRVAGLRPGWSCLCCQRRYTMATEWYSNTLNLERE